MVSTTAEWTLALGADRPSPRGLALPRGPCLGLGFSAAVFLVAQREAGRECVQLSVPQTSSLAGASEALDASCVLLCGWGSGGGPEPEPTAPPPGSPEPTRKLLAQAASCLSQLCSSLGSGHPAHRDSH